MSQKMKNTIVYHGSTYFIDEINVNEGKPYKDFGRGFYVTENRTHAERLALRNKRIELERRGRQCEAYLYTYEFNVESLSDFNVKVFEEPDFEWVQFVLANRKSRNSVHDFDVVMGPTADDDTMIVINAYLDGLYGTIGSDDALNTLIKNIEAENLPTQIFFAKNKAAKLLIPKDRVIRL